MSRRVCRDIQSVETQNDLDDVPRVRRVRAELELKLAALEMERAHRDESLRRALPLSAASP
jgi:hypothetical protein